MDGAFKSPRLDIRMYVLAITIQVIRLTCTQHGHPVPITDVGETALDEEIFEEYLTEMRDHYTADKVCFLTKSLAALADHLFPCTRAVSHLG